MRRLTKRASFAIAVLLAIGCIQGDATTGEYETHTYQTGKMVVERPFDVVKKDLLDSLASYTAADAYARYDAGASHEDFTQRGDENEEGSYRKPYLVYEIRWEVPIFVDTGRRQQSYRIGLGGGPGRHLLAEHAGAGLHVIPSIQMYPDGETTVLEFIVPSSQYAAAFPDTPENRELASQADERFFGFLSALRD